MARRSSGRQGKVVTAGHSTRVEGLDKFIDDVLDKWPEVTQIRLGRLRYRSTVGRRTSQMKVVGTSPEGRTQVASQVTKIAPGGGGFKFRATRWALVGTTITGIRCLARNGSAAQEIVLVGDNLERLKSRLKEEGYGATWLSPSTE